jgi:hypothetical protein
MSTYDPSQILTRVADDFEERPDCPTSLTEFELVLLNACQSNSHDMFGDIMSTCPFNAYLIDWPMFRGHSQNPEINDDIEFWIVKRQQFLLFEAIKADDRDEVKRMVELNYDLGLSRIRIFEPEDPRIVYYLSLQPEEYRLAITQE